MADTPPTWAGRQVTDLTTLTGVADGDWVPIYDVSAPGLKKISASQVIAAVKYTTVASMKNATGHDTNTIAFLSDGTGRSGWFQLRDGAPVEAAGDYQGVELTYAGDSGLHWHRIYDGDVNLAWFGLSESLADNAAPINAAMEYGNATPENHTTANSIAFLVPEGDFTIKSPVYVRLGCTLKGSSLLGSRLNLHWETITPSSITQTGGTATVTCSSSHGLSSGDYVRINGATSVEVDPEEDITASVIDWASHGLSAGHPVYYEQRSTECPNLTDETIYYVIAASSDTVKLATSAANAAAGTAIDLREISGNEFYLESSYNGLYQITVTGANTFTYSVDSANPATFVGTPAVVKHGSGLILNYVSDNTDEDDDVALTFNNNAGMENLTVLPDYTYEPPYGVWCVRIRNFAQFIIHHCRFVLHQAGGGGTSYTDRINGVYVEKVTGFELKGCDFDQGVTHLKFGRLNTTGTCSRAAVNDNYFFSFDAYGIDAAYVYGTEFVGNRYAATSAGDACTGLRFRSSSTGNLVLGSVHREWINYGIRDDGSRNRYYGINAQYTNSGSAVSLKIGVRIDGNNNYLSGLYGYLLNTGVMLGDDSYDNDVEGVRCFVGGNPYAGATAKNRIRNGLGDDPKPCWNFSNTAGYIDTTLGTEIGTTEFSFYIRAGVWNTDASTQGLLFIGDNSGTPAAAANMFRVYSDADGRLVFGIYAATTGDHRLYKTQPDALVRGVSHGIYFARDTSGNVTIEIDGSTCTLDLTTSGTPPSDWAATIDGTQFAVGHTGVAWGGFINEVYLFNEVLPSQKKNLLHYGKLFHLPTNLGQAQSLGSINGDFETNLTGWTATGTATIEQTSDDSSIGTSSMRLTALAANDGVWTNAGASSTSGMRRYRVTFDALWESGTTSWRVSRNDGTGYVDVTIDNASGFDSYEVDIGGELDNTTAILKFAANDAAGAILIDNVTVTELGAIVAWSAEVMPFNAPPDLSGNGLDGTISSSLVTHSHLTPLAALTAADGSTVDATYGAEEAAVLANVVTRQAEIEARLQALGFIS